MDRIMIIGCGGSGKSTLAKRLHEITGLTVIHLDTHFFTGDWIEATKEDWQEINRKLIEQDTWIIDGNYGSTMDKRIERADTIIFMDYPTRVRLWRAFRRMIRHYGKARPDMPEGCKERFQWQFYHYILMYNPTRRKGILNKMEALRDTKKLAVLRSDREAEVFLDRFANEFN